MCFELSDSGIERGEGSEEGHWRQRRGLGLGRCKLYKEWRSNECLEECRREEERLKGRDGMNVIINLEVYVSRDTKEGGIEM